MTDNVRSERAQLTLSAQITTDVAVQAGLDEEGWRDRAEALADERVTVHDADTVLWTNIAIERGGMPPRNDIELAVVIMMAEIGTVVEVDARDMSSNHALIEAAAKRVRVEGGAVCWTSVEVLPAPVVVAA